MNLPDIKQRIAFIVERNDFSIEVLFGGHSKALKFKVQCDDSDWMVKVIRTPESRTDYYGELEKLMDLHFVVPTKHVYFEDGWLYLLFPWIEGASLEMELLSQKDDAIVEEYGVQAALLLKRLHQITIHCNDYKFLLQKKVNCICEEADSLHLSFVGYNDFKDFLKIYAKNMPIGNIVLLHRDIRPENFIINNNCLFLLDFDNGGIGEPEADFVYLTTMGEISHHAFAKVVIANYIEGTDKKAFWNRNLFYSTLQIMEYGIWKWKTKGRQIERQPLNLLQQYDNFNSFVPHWWDDKNIY